MRVIRFLRCTAIGEAILLLLFCAFALVGCGQEVAGVGKGGTGLMGGSVQGQSLSLTNTVSTFTDNGTTSGAAAIFSAPYGICTDGGNLYVTNANSNTISKITLSTGAVVTLAGGPGSNGSVDGTGTAASFDHPTGITTDGTYLYVAEGNRGASIRKISIATGVVTTLAGSASERGATDGIGTAARFNAPSGITTDGQNLYVGDTGNRTIRKIEIGTGAVTTLAGTAGVQGSVDGVGGAATFYEPLDLTTDGTNLYVADYLSVRKVAIASGAVTTVQQVDAAGSILAPLCPTGITTDGTSLYITGVVSVRKTAIATGLTTTVVEQWGATVGVEGAIRIQGITTDGKRLYVADLGNNVIGRVE